MLNDITIEKLEEPPRPGFDCGRPEQNEFFHDLAWHDQDQLLSVTYLFCVSGLTAAYATVCMDALPLHARERGPEIRYRTVGALKLAQIGVDLRFQRRGLGRAVLGFANILAQQTGGDVGCRYVTLDAQPELVGWYEQHGFIRNKLRQRERITDAVAYGRDPAAIAVSMRFDLRGAPSPP